MNIALDLIGSTLGLKLGIAARWHRVADEGRRLVDFSTLLGAIVDTRLERSLAGARLLGAVRSFALLVGLVFLKTAATAITLGCGFGGGVFSPAL